MLHWFNSQDWKVRILLVISLFAVIYTWLIMTYMDTVNSMPIINQFILVSVVIYILAAFIIGLGLRDGMKSIAGTASVLLAVDLLLPPFVVKMDGSLVTSADLVGAQIGAVMHAIWTGFGVAPELVWFFVYPISFTILMAVGVYLLSEKKFTGVLGAIFNA